MQYYVIGSDETKYGPGDLAMLNEWITQGRVTADTYLESVDTGERILASQFFGLVFPHSPLPTSADSEKAWPYYITPKPTSLPADPAALHNVGSTELLLSWVFFGSSFLFCFCLPNIAGIVFANRAIALGKPGGNVSRIANMVMLFLGVMNLIVIGLNFLSRRGYF